jgi:hypothetical protein
MVQPVDEEHVGEAGGAKHDLGARRAPATERMGRTVLGPTVGFGLDDPPHDASFGCVVHQVFTDTVPRYPEDRPSVKGDSQRSELHEISDERVRSVVYQERAAPRDCHEAGFRVTGEEGGARLGPSRRRWFIALAGLWVVGALSVYFLHGWLLDEIVARAHQRGVDLVGCRLDLGVRTIGLDGCKFEVRDARAFATPLANVTAAGSVERVELELDGFSPSRLRVRGARALLQGEPNPRELVGSRPTRPALELPVDIEQSAVSWQFGAAGPAVLLLSDLSFDANSSRLLSRFEIIRRAHGQLSLGPEGLEVTLGDPIQPEVRLIVRVLAKAERVEISLDLRRVPLRIFEGPWLQMTDTLRPIELEGRVFVTVPLGLSMEVPSGDVHLTLHGLSFPVPRELDGLVYPTPPKLSGKLALSRSFERISIPDLSFLAGELAMRGGAELSVEGKGLALEARANGPLSCRAIAESAATAHAESALAALAGSFAQRVLHGSVEVAAAIEGHTSDLEHARVFTTVGIGCGLTPLPVDLTLSQKLLERLPIDLLGSLPRLDGSMRPRQRTGKARSQAPSGLFDLAPPAERAP